MLIQLSRYLSSTLLLCLNLFWVSCCGLYAQSDSAILLSTVDVTSSRLPIAEHNCVQYYYLDSISMYADLSLLSMHCGIHVRQRGPGQAASLSLRGSGASHTAVVWNGVCINNQMLGQKDASLIPLRGFDRIGLLRGGSSSRWGSGAVSGALLLLEDIAFQPETKIELEHGSGSFGRHEQYASFTASRSRHYSSLKFFRHQAENNYPYTFTTDIRHRSDHGRTSQDALLISHAWRTNAKNTLEAHVWLQKAAREIPPTIVQKESKANTEDRLVRSALKWKHLGNSLTIENTFAYIMDENLYNDNLSSSEHLSHRLLLRSDISLPLSLHDKLDLGLTSEYIHASSPNYHQATIARDFDFVLSYQRLFKSSSVSLQLQKLFTERFDNNPYSWTINYSLNLWPSWSIHASFARAFRNPGLNDLFWLPGGNPELTPEQSISQSVELAYRNNGEFSAHVSFFHRDVKDWIIWAPSAKQPQIWSAFNLARVRSYGCSINTDHAWFRTPSFGLHGRLVYELSIATNEKELTIPIVPENSQLTYVPKHKLNYHLSADLSALDFSFSYGYTSSSPGINGELESFHLWDFRLKSQIKFHNWVLRPSLEVNNVLNETYFLVDNVPMPGRSFFLRINFSNQNI